MLTQFDAEAFLATPISLDPADPTSPFAPKAPPTPAAPAFDFSAPHETVVPATPAAPAFDFSAPHETKVPAPSTAPAFDLSKPSTRVYTPDEVKAADPAVLADDDRFSPLEFAQQNPDRQTDPDIRAKLVEAYRIRESRGTTLAQKGKAIVEGTGPAFSALKDAAVKIGETSLALSPAGLAKAVKSALETGSLEPLKQGPVKAVAETLLSFETAQQRTGEAVRKSVRELREGFGKVSPDALVEVGKHLPLGPTTSKADMTPQEWARRFDDDVAGLGQSKLAAEGNAAVAQAVGLNADRLKSDFGIEVDPATIEALSMGTDVVNFIPVGGVVTAVTKTGGRVMTGVLARTLSNEQAFALASALNKASSAASKVTSAAGDVAGSALKSVGGAVESAGTKARSAVNRAGVIGGAGLGALLGHDFYSALGTATVLKAAPRVAEAAGKVLKGAGEVLAGERAVPLAAQMAGGALKGGLHSAADAAALTLPFEIGANQEEEKSVLGMVGVAGLAGAAIGGAAPAVKTGARAAQAKLSESIFRQIEQSEPPARSADPYATDASLDAAHEAAIGKLDPASQKLVNWGRNLLRESGGEIYVVDPATFEKQTGNKNGAGWYQEVGEKVNPDGTSEPFIRILLNEGAQPVAHEFFHALTLLDKAKATGFKNTVASNLTPEQRANFGEFYDSLLNAGQPDKSKWQRLSPEAIEWEVAAEAFSRVMLSQDLSGVAPTVSQKAAQFASTVLEAFGAPLGGFERPVSGSVKAPGVSPLGVKPSAAAVSKGREWMNGLLKSVDDTGKLVNKPPKTESAISNVVPAEVVVPSNPVGDLPVTPRTPSPAPTGPTTPPVTPGVTPKPPNTAPNIRVPKAKQGDFAGQRSQQTGTDRARAAAENLNEPETLARVNEIAGFIESGKPVVELEHAGVTTGGFAQGRNSRRAQQELAYIQEAMGAVPESIRTKYQKVVVPYAMDVQGGKPQVLAMSLDKVLANASRLVELAADHNASKLVPYDNAAGKMSEAGWNQFVRDVQSYAENQSNGYRGDGGKLTRPKEDIGLSIPPENPGHVPTQIPQARADFVNAVQGLNPPLTAREGGGAITSVKMPGNVKGQILAEVNKRQPETPAVIRPEDVKKQDFKSQPGRSVKETNPLRNKLAAAGVPVRELIEVTERINAKDIKSVTPRPDLDFKAPVTDTIRAGFQPKTDDRSWVGAALKAAQTPGSGHYIFGSTKSYSTLADSAALLQKGYTSEEFRNFSNSTQREISDLLEIAYKQGAIDYGTQYYPKWAGEGRKNQTFRGRELPPKAEQKEGGFQPEVELLAPELEQVKSGTKDGETFNLDGSIFRPSEGQKLDVVTLASENIPVDELSPERLQKFLSKYSELLKNESVKPGVFRLSSSGADGPPRVSLDLNVVVDQAHRKNTEAFARLNQQESFFDLSTFEPVSTGGTGETVLKTPTEIAKAAEKIAAGEPVEFSAKGETASIAEMTPEQFAEASKSWEGGLTSKAYETGLDVKTAKAVADLKTRADAAGIAARNAIKARDFTKAGIEASRTQFFREAYETATDTGSAAMPGGWRKSFSDRKAPFPEGGKTSFQPKTDTGKAMAERGIDFEMDGQLGGRIIRAYKDGEVIGYASTKQTGPKEAEILLTAVDESERGQGVGQALYREAFQQLKDDGVTKVKGSFVGPAPLAIRKKIFGKVEGLTSATGPIEFEPALKNLKKTGDLNLVEGFNTITPESQFQPTMREMEESWAKAKADAKKAPKKTQTLEKPSLWILPDGSRAPLNTALHENDLSARAEEFNKKYGTKFDAKKPDAQDRVDALNKGFVRVRYTANKGQMAVELNQDFWKGKTKKAVFDAVALHEDKIDKITLGLTDDEGNARFYDEASVFKAEDKAQALEDFLAGVRTSKEKKAGAAKGPSDIQRMRSLPGDFQPKSEDIIFAKGWLSPDGDFTTLRSAEASTHEDFAQKMAPPGDSANSSEALFKKGWLRFTPYGTDSGMVNTFDGKLPTKAQRAALEGWAENSDGLRTLILDNGTGVKTLWSPPKSRFQPRADESAPMLDLGLPSEEQMKQIRVKTRVAKAKDNHPEAVAPTYQRNEDGSYKVGEDGKPKPVALTYDLLDSPLAKEAAHGVRGTETRGEAYTDALSKRLVSAAKQAAKDPAIQAGVTWYSTARTRLKKLLGDDSKFFAELLGATSARTPVDINFRFALDAYNQFKAGKFDETLAKYREGKSNWDAGDLAEFKKDTGNEDPTRGQYLDWWVDKHDLSPTQSNGKKFGANSRSVLRVLDGSWANEVQGPKTPNFAGNLSGSTFEATVDVWAARLLHRLSHEGAEGRWRILPENETGVTDTDFYLGQAAYRKAAEKLGMKPDALQAILWFYEKNHWEKEGWTRGAGAEKSDFNTLLKETEKSPLGQLQTKKPQLDFGLGISDIRAKK